MDSKQEALTTERLILRPMDESDAGQLYQIWSEDEVTRFMYFDSLENEDQAREAILASQTLYQDGTGAVWGIFLKSGLQLIGTIGIQNWNKASCLAEIGYELAKAHWKKGLMREALGAVLNYGFRTLKLNRIEAWVFPENKRSITLLNKAGFKKEGLIRQHVYCKGRFHDEYCFSMLYQDWI